MRRISTAVACAIVVVAGALYAQSSSTLTVRPSEMREGETKTVTDDDRSITIRREGNTTHVRIDGAESTEQLTITRDGDRIRIGRSGREGSKSFVIDGLPLRDLENPRRQKSERTWQTFFVCPKDQTTLRVPEDKAGQTFRCPIDGTNMEKRKGRGFTFFFDDSSIEL